MTDKKQKLELTWVGKDEALKLEPRILIEDSSKSYGDQSSENMLIHGDNLLALKALEQDFTNKIKCIYIDPPYNTGSRIDADGKEIGYEDGLEHSIWLNLMKPRLIILKKLLSDDGSLWISIDENEMHYLKVLCDEIFGRKNFVIQTVIQRGAATGHKAINPSPVQVCDHLLCYAKDKDKWNYKPIYKERDFDKAYSQYISNYGDNYENWKFESLKEVLKKEKISIDEAIQKFPERIIRFAQPDYNAVGNETKQLIDVSKSDNSKIYKQVRAGYPDIYLYKGNRILFYKDKLKNINGKLTTAELVTNLWTDMNYQGIASEGGVVFRQSKKPELQVKRILEMSTEENDYVLDSFLGSGTTSAVSHKMKRKWIGIELADQANTHCLPRLKSIVDGKELSGITKSVNWTGGNGFKFYELAPSLLRKDSFGNFVIDEQYNANMLAAAMCKHEGFKYSPDEAIYWKQGRSTETDYIFVTTGFVTKEQLDAVHAQMTENESLLICAKSFAPGSENHYSNITIKKIPQMILGKCEFAKDNYDLNIVKATIEEAEESNEAQDEQ